MKSFVQFLVAAVLAATASAFTLTMKTGWRSPYLNTVGEVELPSFSDIKADPQPASYGAPAAGGNHAAAAESGGLPDFSTFKADGASASAPVAAGSDMYSSAPPVGGGNHGENTNSLPDFSQW